MVNRLARYLTQKVSKSCKNPYKQSIHAQAGTWVESSTFRKVAGQLPRCWVLYQGKSLKICPDWELKLTIIGSKSNLIAIRASFMARNFTLPCYIPHIPPLFRIHPRITWVWNSVGYTKVFNSLFISLIFNEFFLYIDHQCNRLTKFNPD